MARQRGFTLLEMLVVMVLMGLVTTLALPAMQRWHDAVQNKAKAAEIVDALRAAGFNAGANRREIVVDGGSFRQPAAQAATTGASAPQPGNAAIDTGIGLTSDRELSARQVQSRLESENTERLALALPDGWQAQRVDDIHFLANGLCRPGSIELRTERGDLVRVEVRGPLCGVELAQDQGGTSR